MSLIDGVEITQHIPSETEKVTSEILERIKHSPQLAHAIGHMLIEYAERDIAEMHAQYDKGA